MLAFAMLAGLVITAGFSSLAVPGAEAAAGTPGVPGAPTVLYNEDFENVPNGSRSTLATYTGATGQTYTADPFWLNTTMCNGMVIDSTTAWNGADCLPAGGTAANANTWFNMTKSLAQVLGQVAGSASPTTNAAVGAFTAGNGTNNSVEFQTATPISLPSATGRFVTFSVNAAATSCSRDFPTVPAAGDPRLAFYLKDGSGERAVASSPINVCADGTLYANGGQTTRAGSHVADGAILLTGTTFDVVMRNQVGTGFGNDHAFDNVKVLDVTPQLDKSFSPTSVPVGGTSKLTFTVTNTSELAVKNGWSFTDSLPAGLTLASPTTAATTCPSGVMTAAVGATSVGLSGNLSDGMTSCTFSVNVTSNVAGSYTNGPTNITSVGLNAPGTSTVAFIAVGPTITCSSDPNLFNTGYNSATGGVLANLAKDANWDGRTVQHGRVDSECGAHFDCDFHAASRGSLGRRERRQPRPDRLDGEPV